MSPLFLAIFTGAHAQVWVAPRRPGQSIVRYDRHDWQTIELLADASIDGDTAGGVRMFFYQPGGASERAAAHLEQAYRSMVEEFDFVPPDRFDYVVYGSYQEFLRTNLFPVQEGILGATAPRGLEIALPYFGDHQAFWHTSTHELAHEFTIQKVRDAPGASEVWGDPVGVLPLWFVEGLAEYVALGPIADQSAMRIRDLVANPDLFRGYGLLGFWDDYPSHVLWTYAGGHARITFLEETYGEDIVQRILERTPAVLSKSGRASRISSFEDLVTTLADDDEDRIAARFDAWIKARAFDRVLKADQTFADVVPLDRVAGVPLTLDASADGALIAYRSLSRHSGRTGLFVVDPRHAASTRRIAADRRPGVESLHPIDPRNFDITTDRIAYVAASRGHDILVVQEISHEAEEREGPEPGLDASPEGQPLFDLPGPDEGDDATWWRVRIRKHGKQRYRLRDVGLVAATSVALEPGGDRIVVVGLDDAAVRDLWLITPTGERHAYAARRLTDDVAAEHDVSWGPNGLVYGSDGSADGRVQLFRLDPDLDRPPEQITTQDRDHRGPVALSDGAVVYSAYIDGAAQLFSTDGGETIQLTDLATGAFDPQAAPDGDLWALVQHQGALRPARLPAAGHRAEVSAGPPAAAGPPVEMPTRSLDLAQPYRPAQLRNWGIDGGFAALGAGAGALFGQLYVSASDRLRDHALVLSAQAYGTPELVDAQLLYLDQSSRITWGAGPFHGLRFRVDETVDTDLLFQSAERFYGLVGSARFPLDRYVYLQLDQAIGGVSYFLFEGDEILLRDGVINGSGRDLVPEWESANPFPRWQSETTLRLGIDTTRFHPKTGPVAGTTWLLEGTFGIQPVDGQQYGSLRLDAQQYLPLPLISGGNLAIKGSVATSGLGPYARGYWLSSYDTLRGYTWGDPALLGRHYWFAGTEIQVPLDAVLRTALASSIEGVAGLDVGGVADDPAELWDRRALDGALGANFILGSLVLRMHFARAIDIGAPLPVTPTPWVTNLSISWLGI